MTFLNRNRLQMGDNKKRGESSGESDSQNVTPDALDWCRNGLKKYKNVSD
jgi:hypothetical protein